MRRALLGGRDLYRIFEMSYTNFFQARGAGTEYDRVTYAEGSLDAHVHELQARWLRGLVGRTFPEGFTHVDYACGTGRILQITAGLATRAIGYDTSAEMLTAARAKSLPATFVQVDPEAPPARAAVDAGDEVLVTIFRLLLNADDKTRADALRFAAETLRAARRGILVVNNHGNKASLRELARLRRNRQGPWFHSLGVGHVDRLLDDAGLRVVSRHGFALLPQSTYRSPAAGVARRVNARVAGRTSLAAISTDVVVVAAAK